VAIGCFANFCLTWEGQLQYDTNVLPYLLLGAFQGDVAQVAETNFLKGCFGVMCGGSTRPMPGVSGTQLDVTSPCNDCEGGHQCNWPFVTANLQHLSFFTWIVA
jgi:hypothetical protein